MMTLRNSFFLCLLACTMSRSIPYRCAVWPAVERRASEWNEGHEYNFF